MQEETFAGLVTPFKEKKTFNEVGRKNIKYVLSVSCYWGKLTENNPRQRYLTRQDSPAKMLLASKQPFEYRTETLSDTDALLGLLQQTWSGTKRMYPCIPRIQN